ncbi:MAG: hypothetical protein PHG87_02000 [Candidatus Omnitrophica bacterium]|nr:hypothetical protein [Candidatus Omnitrophota bacterium]
MEIKFKTAFILAAAFLGAGIFPASYAEENNKPAAKAETGVVIEQALKNYETYKQKEQDELAKKLNFSLNQIIQNWIASAKANKENALGSRLEQSWEKLSSLYPVSPVPYEYYLRGYKYSLIKSDVAKTDSIFAPYKATVTINEDLYVEKNHSPDISDANPYFYTVTTAYNLNLEYRQDKFVLINSDSKIVGIINDAPSEIKKFRF